MINSFQKWVIGWILLFTALVIYALVSIRNEASTRRIERDNQLALLAKAGHAECVKAFSAMTHILSISIPPQKIKTLPEDKQQIIAELFMKADPKINCPPSNINRKAVKKLRQGG